MQEQESDKKIILTGEDGGRFTLYDLIRDNEKENEPYTTEELSEMRELEIGDYCRLSIGGGVFTLVRIPDTLQVVVWVKEGVVEQIYRPDGKDLSYLIVDIDDDSDDPVKVTYEHKETGDVLEQAFSKRETTTLLAALSYLHANRTHAIEMMAEHFYDQIPLSSKEIDQLCERINVAE